MSVLVILLTILSVGMFGYSRSSFLDSHIDASLDSKKIIVVYTEGSKNSQGHLGWNDFCDNACFAPS